MPGPDRRDRRARTARAADRDAEGGLDAHPSRRRAATCSSSRPARASSRCCKTARSRSSTTRSRRAEIDDARARAQLEAAQAELEAIDARRVDRRPLAGRAAAHGTPRTSSQSPAGSDDSPAGVRRPMSHSAVRRRVAQRRRRISGHGRNPGFGRSPHPWARDRPSALERRCYRAQRKRLCQICANSVSNLRQICVKPARALLQLCSEPQWPLPGGGRGGFRHQPFANGSRLVPPHQAAGTFFDPESFEGSLATGSKNA